MLKPVVWNTLSASQKKALLQRDTSLPTQELTNKVQDIIKTVQTQGDKALYEFTQQFDKVDLGDLAVTKEEFETALSQVSAEVIQAFEQVISQLTSFHQPQKLSNYAVETAPGIVCERRVVPIQRVGLYVPAGTAPLVSTVLMLGVPSSLANNPLRVLCAPPNKKGSFDPSILVAAKLCGIEKVYKVGGAQAIAAMAYGTQSIPKVDKIFGPGNSWVTMAKMLVSLDANGAQLDIPAGPSEVMVIADEKANPAFVAADLLSQAEHGPDSQVVLVCNSEAFAAKVNEQLEQQLKALSRKAILCVSLQASLSLVVDTLEEAIAIANDYAPEHLILQVENPRVYLPKVLTAGSVFLGPYSPESAGDYASGTTHVLPTAGFARATSGLSVTDFMRTMSVQELTQTGLAAIAQTVNVLTTIEGLDAHRLALNIRLGGES